MFLGNNERLLVSCQVDTLLALIPLTVVDSRREVDEVKELISIAKCAPWLPNEAVLAPS